MRENRSGKAFPQYYTIGFGKNFPGENFPLYGSKIWSVKCTTYDTECIYNLVFHFYLSLGVVIGLEETAYTVEERDRILEVCAVLRQGSLAREAIVTLSSGDDTAVGMCSILL